MKRKSVILDSVVARFERTLDAGNVDAFVTAMWNEDEETASEMLSRILWDSISYFDYGEDYYHGMLNGIFTSRGYMPEGYERQLVYGIAFYGKKAKVKIMR